MELCLGVLCSELQLEEVEACCADGFTLTRHYSIKGY
jgi:hypothetical protein